MCVKDVRVSKYTSTLTLSSRTHTVTHELIQINKQQKGKKSKKKYFMRLSKQHILHERISLSPATAHTFP